MRPFLLIFVLLFVTGLEVTGTTPLTATGPVCSWDLSSFPNGAVPYMVNPNQPAGAIPINPSGTSASDLISAVRAAFQVWQDISTAKIRYTFQGTTTRGSGLDGVNVVTFSPTTSISASAATSVFCAMRPGPVLIPGGQILTAKFAGQIVE